MPQRDLYKKFDNEMLNEIRSYGGSPISVYKQLALFKKTGQCIYKHYGLVDFNKLMISLSLNDWKIITSIIKEYKLTDLNVTKTNQLN